MTRMSAVLYVPGLGHATSCAISERHAPRPVRYVWHHVLPQACGGTTDLANLAELCDNCHYTVHELMTLLLAKFGPGNTSGILDVAPLAATLRVGLQGHKMLAANGYLTAVHLGTAAHIPDEGHAGVE